MATLHQVLTLTVRSVACGFLALVVPLLLVGGWLLVELNWMEQPADGSDSHIRGGFYILLVVSPLLWLATTVWFLVLAIAKQFQFRRAFLLSLIAAFILPGYLVYAEVGARSPAAMVAVVLAVGLIIALASAWLSSWTWSQLNATWSN
jgi:hypothetical protein